MSTGRKKETGTGSFAARLSLGRELRAARLAAGKSAGDFQVRGIGAQSKLQRIEKGESPVRRIDVEAMCDLYGIEQETEERLIETASHTNDHGWWEAYGNALPNWIATYIGIEAAASVLRPWDPELIHGLLQTPDYMRAIFSAHPDATPEYIHDQVEIRCDRQRAVFERTPPVEVQAIIGEGALHRLVGGENVMAEQRAHLLKMSEERHIDVRVLPWSVGAHVAMTSAFTIVEFAVTPAPVDVVYLETLAGGRYVEDEKMLRQYREVFDAIWAQSTSIQEYTS